MMESSSFPNGIDWESQVRNGGGFFSVEDDYDAVQDVHIDLDDDIYGMDHNRKMYLSNGSHSLVFQTNLIKEIEQLSSFEQFLPGTTHVTSDGGIRKSIMKAGNGINPPDGAQVWVHYIGFAEGLPEPIDSTQVRRCLNSFKLDGSTLPFLDISLRSMEFNEVALFVAMPEYAYGELGCPPRIPPKSRVLFIIELIAMDASSQQPIFLLNTEDRQGLPFETIHKEAERLRGVGNDKFQSKDYEGALRCYKVAAGLLYEYRLLDSDYPTVKNVQLYKLLSNMAECFLRLEEYQSVLDLFKEVKRRRLRMPDGKLLVRYAKALVAQTKHKEALEAVKDALELEPGHVTILALMHNIKKLIEQDSKESDKFCNRMFKLYLNDLTEEKPGDLKKKSVKSEDMPVASTSSSGNNPPDLPCLVNPPEAFSAAAGISMLYNNMIKW